MKNISKLFSLLLLIGGIGIIIAAYFLLLKDIQEDRLFYLNLVFSCILYVVVLVPATDIFGTLPNVAKSGSGFGIKWHGIWIYAPLALALIIASMAFGIEFKYCLMGHIVLLFGLSVIFLLGFTAKANVNEVMERIEARKSGLKEISGLVDMLEMECNTGRGREYLDKISNLKEDLRFVSASDNQTAIMLEERLAAKIRLITSQIVHSSQSPENIHSGLDECKSIIELRKKQY